MKVPVAVIDVSKLDLKHASSGNCLIHLTSVTGRLVAMIKTHINRAIPGEKRSEGHIGIVAINKHYVFLIIIWDN